MLKEKDDNNHAQVESDFVCHRKRMQALIEGLLPEQESLAYLRQISGGPDGLTGDVYRAAIEAVRASALPNAQQLFAGSGKLIDCCGTGGSGLAHYNTSTTVAFVLAAAGLKVAKFGNRAASNRSGSFDLLDKLGIGATLPLESLAGSLERTDLVFLFAPQFYPALAGLAPLRRAVGQPTVFNFIGPLLNPASPVLRVIGVPNKHVQTLAAMLLKDEAQVEQAFVVTSDSGLDELDVHAANNLLKVSSAATPDGVAGPEGHTLESEVLERMFDSPLQGMSAGLLSADDNMEIFRSLLGGDIGMGNYYHAIVCLNAAASLRLAGLAQNIDEGFKQAAALLKDGSVKAKFEQYQKQFSQINS